MVAKLFWPFLPSYLTSDIWSHWSFIPWMWLNIRRDVGFPNILKLLWHCLNWKAVLSNFKELVYQLKGTKRIPNRDKYIPFVFILIYYSSFKCWKVKTKKSENMGKLSTFKLNPPPKGTSNSETLTYLICSK